MKNFSLDDLVLSLGGMRSTAAIAGVGRTAVANWMARGAVPAGRWAKIVGAAQGAGLDWVTYEWLAALAAVTSSEIYQPVSETQSAHASCVQAEPGAETSDSEGEPAL